MRMISRWMCLAIFALCGLLPALAADVIVPAVPPVLAFKQVGMVPLRPMAEITGATLTAAKGSVTVKLGAHSFTFTTGSTAAKQDGTKIKLPLAPFTSASITYVPVRALVTALGGTLGNGDTPKTLRVTFPDRPPFDMETQEVEGQPKDFAYLEMNSYLVKTDGSRVQQMSYDVRGFGFLSFYLKSAHFSLDGKSILYTKGTDIYRRTLDSPTGVNLTAEFSEKSTINLRPFPCGDGSLIFLQANEPDGENETEDMTSESTVYLCRILDDGTGFERLATGMLPIVSADGSVVAYIDSEGDEPVLKTMSTLGRGERTLGKGYPDALSPDGSMLYYWAGDDAMGFMMGGEAPELSTVDTRNGRVLYPNDPISADRNLLGPSITFTADGKFIAYATPGSGIWVMNADRTNFRQITTNGKDSNPRFSPDGTRIAFLRDDHLYIMQADGSKVKALAPSLMGADFSFSPDGTFILLSGMSSEAVNNLQRVMRKRYGGHEG